MTVKRQSTENLETSTPDTPQAPQAPTQVANAVVLIRSTWGRLDALVNNAGVAVFKPIGDTITLGRYGTPEEIAAAVAFLCGPVARYIHGQDGGFNAAGVGLPTLRGEGRG